MSEYRAEAVAIVNAKPAHVYGIIADYHEGHQRILPRRYFEKMIVREGGVGAGTKLTLHMNIFGTKTTIHQTVSEPEPGRLLVEANDDGSATTTFLCEPINEGTHTLVTITTIGTVATGWRGWVERWMNPMVLQWIYRKELMLLDDVAQQVEG